MRKASLLLLTLVSCALASTALARSPDTFDENYAPPIIIDSPQWFAFELKLGPYQPAGYRAFKQTFASDRGWLLATELDVTAWHVPYVGQLNVGLGWGWANYDAIAASASGTSGEETELTLYPMSLLAVLRVDALARYTVVPVTFAAKLGSDFVRWKATTGDATDGNGLNVGLRWGLQAAFELDFFDEKSARRLDEDFGINHTFILFEFFESKTRGTGDRSFQFGLGLQF